MGALALTKIDRRALLKTGFAGATYFTSLGSAMAQTKSLSDMAAPPTNKTEIMARQERSPLGIRTFHSFSRCIPA